jgi:hypothetical protein
MVLFGMSDRIRHLSFISPRSLLSALVLAVSLSVVVAWASNEGQTKAPKTGQKAEPNAETDKQHEAASSDGYVGSAACTRCHLAIANQFTHTSMGRSLTRITPDFLKTLSIPGSYYDPRSDHHFEVHAENSKLYQTEYQTAASGANAGQDVFRNTHELEWIIGTGENGFGALLRRDGYLFQAPLSFYSKPAKWDLSPGYQNGDYGFNRIILPGCIYCHSGRPRPVAGFVGKYDATPFTQTPVGCENCHGPGSAHVQAMRNGEDNPRGKDPTILNPAFLTSQLSDDLCMSCHQTGDARVLKPGKTYQDFRPGKPLDETLSIFQVPPTRENPPQDDHVEHYYSMTLSKCYRTSANRPGSKQMRCITCHDPHVEPTAAEAPAFYNSKCLSCHTSASCTAPKETRQNTTPVDNCIACHMPKRDVVVISHSSITNHRILARPGEPFPDAAFEQTTQAMPDLIHLNPAGERGSKAATPSALTRLQAYALLKTAKPQFTASWRNTLSELETSNPENAIVQAALGRRDLEDHKLPEAIDHLKHALRLDPVQPEVYVDLSEAEDQSGQIEAAIGDARKAVELDPFVAALQKTLVFRLISGKHYPEAQAAMEKYLQNFPEDDFMRKMLAMAKE